jgi:DNA-binding transcriptional LysR family regulator
MIHRQLSRADVAGIGDAATSIAAIRTFVDAIDRGSLTASARALNLSQSTASTQVTMLSRLAGGPLFKRRDGRLALTALGRVMYDSGRDLIQSAESLRKRLSSELELSRGGLNIAASLDASEATLARILSGFEATGPDVRIAVAIKPAALAQAQLETETVDILLAEESLKISGCRFRPYDSATIRLAMRPDHKLAQAANPIVYSQLSTFPIIATDRHSTTQRFVDSRVTEYCTALPVSLEIDSSESMIACLEAGLGVGFLSQAQLARPLALGSLVARDVADIDLTRTFHVGYRIDRDVRPVVATFVSWLTSPGAYDCTVM